MKPSLILKRSNPYNGESSSITSKSVMKSRNLPPPHSIEDIVNDIVHNRNYNTISSRYPLMNDKDQNSIISVVLLILRTYNTTP